MLKCASSLSSSAAAASFRTCHFLDLHSTCFAHTTLGLAACLMIWIRFAMEIAGVFKYPDHPGPAAMALCLLLDAPPMLFIGLNGGTACVVVLTLDRYWKIVYSIHHRKHYRRWMLYVGLFLPWLDGIASSLLPAIGTTRIVNGVCIPLAFWPSNILDKVRTGTHV